MMVQSPLLGRCHLFKAPGKVKTTEFLNSHLPEGRVWGKKNAASSNMYRLNRSLSAGYEKLREQIEHHTFEMYVPQSTDLLPDFEESVGLPDECETGSLSLDERRNKVINKLRRIAIITLEEMQEYVDSRFSDLEIELIPGEIFYGYAGRYPFPYWGAASTRFVIVVKLYNTTENGYPYQYPFAYRAGSNIEKIKCVLHKIIPANVVLAFNYNV